MPWLWIIAGLLLLIPVGFSCLLFLIALFERQWTRHFSPLPLPLGSNTWPDAVRNNEAAQRAGLLFAGTFPQCRGRMYKTVVTLWFSEDSTILAVIHGGGVGGLSWSNTVRIFSQTSEVILETSNQDTVVDFSGILRREIIWDADFDQLWLFHLSRCAAEPARLRFNTKSPTLCLEAIRERICASASQRGWIRPVVASQGTYRMTVKAAAYLATIGFWGSLVRDIAAMRRKDSVPGLPPTEPGIVRRNGEIAS